MSRMVFKLFLLAWLILIFGEINGLVDPIPLGHYAFHHPHEHHMQNHTMQHIFDEKNSSEWLQHHGIHRCGGPKHSFLTRPCLQNDTYCGHWVERYWHPIFCHYQNITAVEARKCLGNRTLAFIGDSQNRDIAVGVARFLMGHDLSDALNEKFGSTINLFTDGAIVPPFEAWSPNNVNGYNAFVFPKPDIAARDSHTWQIQSWNLFSGNYQDRHIVDVLNNNMVFNQTLLRNIDLAFYSWGLHNIGWFPTPTSGEMFYNEVIKKRWDRIRHQVAVPSVWVSMNNECKHLIEKANVQEQPDIVEDVNYYVNRHARKDRLPYWDASAPLRTPDRCNISADGVHVNMFVDIMRAKMLFNHLCDAEMKWRGSPDLFE